MTDAERENRRRLRAVVKKLQLVMPTLYPVEKVEFKPCEDAWGSTRVKQTKDPSAPPTFIISIHSEIDDVAKLFVLVHEYAHAAQWRVIHQENLREKDHDPEWGVCYAKVWELTLAFLEPEDE